MWDLFEQDGRARGELWMRLQHLAVNRARDEAEGVLKDHGGSLEDMRKGVDNQSDQWNLSFVAYFEHMTGVGLECALASG
jgi:hypothetical protein